MKDFKVTFCLLTGVLVSISSACSKGPSGSVSASINNSLDRAGLVDVTVKQDVDKGVITLGGHVPGEADKAQAESLAKSAAGNLVVANEIAILTPGAESEARKVNEALDKGIESNLEAALVAERLNDVVKFSVKNHVVTLKGDVVSQELRGHAEQLATGVPYVHQVVNELQVKKQKATSSN